MRAGTVTFAGRVNPGDAVLAGDDFVVVTAVRKAPGRKPKVGENLLLVGDNDVLRFNSTDPVRVRRHPR